MRCARAISLRAYLRTIFLLFAAPFLLTAQNARRSTEIQPSTNPSLAQFLAALHTRARSLESASGMRSSFLAFVAAHHLPPDSIRYSDYVMARLLFEATRDAGLWNLHWSITDQPPNSDRIWQQWKTADRPSVLKSTATAECDELSALYAFLAEREGLKTVGLFWPYANHTVAVWVLKPTAAPAIRVVVPTSQIFLTESDMFDTRKFDPWRQKIIYEYTRRDAPDSYEFPKPLFDFFLQQVDKYAGASDATLQRLRYLREAVLLRAWTPEQAAQDALRKRDVLGSGPEEDRAAFYRFAVDMRSEPAL